MDKDFMEYAYARTEKTLMENTEYKILQKKCADASKDKNMWEYENLSCEIEYKVRELCYMQGFNDAIRLLIKS